MADTKKEHYVPRCYLENFATEEKRINVFDKWKLMVRNNQNIMNVAMENAFYDIDLINLMNDLDSVKYEKMKNDLMKIVGTDKWEDVEKIIGNKKYIEKEYFVKIEGAYSKVLKSVIGKSYNGNTWGMKRCNAMSEKEKFLLSFFIAVQVFRTKRFRETLGDMIEGTAQVLAYKCQKNDIGKKTKEKFKVKANIDFVKLQHSMMILEPNMVLQLTETLEKHIWVMCVNKTSMPFYTSDEPVVKIPHIQDKFISHSGFASPGIEIAFPITPNLMICMYDSNAYGNIFTDRQFYEMNDVEEIKYYNCYQIIHSYRCVFAREHDFSLAINYCHKHPELMKY